MILKALALLALAGGARAAGDPAKVYEGMMSDGDLYVGEGVVSPAAYAGDLDKAKASGRERARGGLVEGIRVKISSTTTDTMNEKGSNFEAKSTSVAELELEGIQYKYLEGYPKPDQLTVLAYLSKEEYFRQADKRVLGYRMKRGLRLFLGRLINNGLEQDGEDYKAPPPPLMSGRKTNGPSETFSLGADFYRDAWFAGFSVTQGSKYPFVYEPTAPGNVGGYAERTNFLAVGHVKLGYEWVPWATRFQLVLPAQAEYGLLAWDQYYAHAFGVAGGLLARYWAADRVAFDAGIRWHQGLAGGEVRAPDGKPLLYKPGTPALFNLSGPELALGIVWNGF